MKRTIVLTLMLSAAFIATPAHAQLTEEPHFHHTHLNVVDVDKSIAYYQQMFGTPKVKFRDVADAVLTDRSFFLFNKVDKPAPWEMISGIYHLGWGGVNG